MKINRDIEMSRSLKNRQEAGIVEEKAAGGSID